MGVGRGHIYQYYVDMLPLVAKRSTCVRRQVAAIITNSRNQILSTGYNGVPSWISHCTDNPCPGAKDQSGDTRKCEAVHAEQNAIIQCTRLEDARIIYCSCTPCFVCAKMLLNTPIELIIVVEPYPDKLALDILKRGHRQVLYAPYFREEA